jgi:hypothetical protein
MSILLSAVDVRHEQRVRVVFTTALASGAFGVPGPAYYSIENLDGKGANPSISAALIVANSPNVVELVLSIPLARGASYTLAAEGVPAVDLTVTPVGSATGLRWGAPPVRENHEVVVSDRDRLLYGTDLLFNGNDYEETPTNDLGDVSGAPNVTKALNNRAVSEGLPWKPSHGGKLRQFVDSPSAVSGTMKGQLTSQFLQDPRVNNVKVSHEVEDDKTYLHADPTLVSGETAERVTVPVPSE